MTACTDCGAALESPVGCAKCGVLGKDAEGSTPFEIFGLDLAWPVETGDLKKRLLRFSRICHPDFFATSSDELRELAERNSAVLNEAFEVLSDDFRRASWLLTHLGGPSEQEERQMPQAFLMEVLDWNETLEEARSAPDDDNTNAQLEELARNLGTERGESMNQIAMLLDPIPERGSPSLTELRKLLNAIRYVDRTLGEIRALRLQRSTSN